MSFIAITDKHGNPLKYINIRLALGRVSSDDAYDDRFTDLAGHTAWPNPLASDDGYTLYVNYANVQTTYGSAKQFVGSLEASDITIQLDSLAVPTPSTCPVDHNKDQFSTWFHAHKVGDMVSMANMQAMQPSLTACGMKWQNQDRGDLRPRIFQPPLNAIGASEWAVDCGDFDKPWVLTFRY